MKTLAILLLYVSLFLLAGGCGDDETTQPPQLADCSSIADTTQAATVSYANDIFPLFEPQGYNCNSSGCHGSPLVSSNYAVSTYEDLFMQGDEAVAMNICSIKPGDPDASYLYLKMKGQVGTIQGERMPLGGPVVTPADLDLMRVWILEGARNN
jgi:hypothetical protein